MTFDEIVYKCSQNEPFAFSRWGDGEWMCLLGKGTQNCDKHQYFDSLRKRLADIVKSNPDYHMGMAKHKFMSKLDGEIKAYCKEHKINRTWEATDQFVQASKASNLDRLSIALKNRKVCTVGKMELMNVIDSWGVLIPKINCWENYTKTIDSIKWTMDSPDIEVFLFCAGMMSNVLIDDLYKYNPNKIYIDLGSVLDPYAGLQTRGYHKDIDGHLHSNL